MEEERTLPVDMQAKLARMIDAIRIAGVVHLPPSWAKPLGDRLWELRITGKDGIARAIYVLATGRRLVIVRIFMKKTQKTPLREVKLARQRVRDAI